MIRQYAIFQLRGGYDLQLAKGFDNKNRWLPDVRFNTENEAILALHECYDLDKGNEFVVLPVYKFEVNK